MAQASHRIFLAILLLSLTSGCGGSERSAASADGSGEHAEERKQSGEGAESDDSASSDGEAESAPAERKASCDDGTCTPCGDALCPSGWYCDESAKGGPACGWLPECAREPSCACVKRAFSGCSCAEQGGAPHLTCG